MQRSSVYWPTGHEAGEHSPRDCRAAGAYGLSACVLQDQAGAASVQSSGRATARRDVGRSHAFEALQGRSRRAACEMRHPRCLASLGTVRGRARLHGGNRACRDRRGRMSSSGTDRITRCRWRCTRASPSSMGWATSRSTPATADESTATGLAKPSADVRRQGTAACCVSDGTTQRCQRNLADEAPAKSRRHLSACRVSAIGSVRSSYPTATRSWSGSADACWSRRNGRAGRPFLSGA